MEYTANKLAIMSGVSTQTLRYYDEIDLLKPKKAVRQDNPKRNKVYIRYERRNFND